MSQAKPPAVGKSRRGIDAPTPARVEDCRSIGRSPSSEGEPTGTGGERKVPASSSVSRLCCKKIPSGGSMRRLRRERWGCRPEGGSTFFRCERKYQRKPAARRLREKAFYCPFLKEGVRNVARNGVGQLSPALGARSCSPFSAVKMGGPFSLRCLSPLCSPAAGVGQTQPMRVGMLRRRLDGFAVSINRPVSQLTVGGGLT